MKEYKPSEMHKAFSKSQKNMSFPSVCMECGGDLDKNEDFDYASDWTASYTCEECESKFAYQPSDMGQSLPWLVKYNDKKDVFK